MPSSLGLLTDGDQNLKAANCGFCGRPICELLMSQQPSRRDRSLERGQNLEASSLSRLWTVTNGLVGLCTLLPDGRRQIIALATSGETVCPLPSSNGSDLWVEALAPSQLCELPLPVERPELDGNGALSAELFMIMQRQARIASAHLVTLGRLDGMERVCLFLTDMALRLGVRSQQGWRVHLPLSREDIADYLGLNAETVSRIFTRVKKSKLATFQSPTEYLVPDLEALQSRAPIVALHGQQSKDGHDLGSFAGCRT